MLEITLKLDNQFNDTLNTTRNDLIKRLVIYYKFVLKKEKFKVQIRKALFKVRDKFLKNSQEFENSFDDAS